MPKQKKPQGRPARPMPDRIDAPPEEIARRVLSLPQGHKWRYLTQSDPDSEAAAPEPASP